MMNKKRAQGSHQGRMNELNSNLNKVLLGDFVSDVQSWMTCFHLHLVMVMGDVQILQWTRL